MLFPHNGLNLSWDVEGYIWPFWLNASVRAFAKIGQGSIRGEQKRGSLDYYIFPIWDQANLVLLLFRALCKRWELGCYIFTYFRHFSFWNTAYSNRWVAISSVFPFLRPLHFCCLVHFKGGSDDYNRPIWGFPFWGIGVHFIQRGDPGMYIYPLLAHGSYIWRVVD